MGRGGWKGGGGGGGGGGRGAKREGTRWEGCRGPYARGWGLTTTTPQRRGFLFVPREFLFVSFPVARPHLPQPHPIPPSESFDSSARLCHPPLLHPSHPPFASSFHHLLSTSLPITVHLKYEFDITFHPTALARPPPRTSSSVLSLAVSSPPRQRPSDHYWSPHNLIAGILLKVSTARRLVYDFAN